MVHDEGELAIKFNISATLRYLTRVSLTKTTNRSGKLLPYLIPKKG
jgi:hypothetical protein